ncbi:AAA family ATPase [Streptomyces sp. NPDC056773]|uniref:AAA family ATPase n=1 Tax=unclassified Streptomyces TaxID=2593676 RepID=UPI00367FF7A2
MDPMRRPAPPETSDTSEISEFPGLPDLVHLAAVLDGLARNPALPEELALRLLPYGEAPLCLSRREGITPSAALCEAFLARGEAEALAYAESLPPAVADRLAADADPRVRAARATVEGVGVGRHPLFVADPEADVRLALAGRSDLSAGSLAALAGDPDARVRKALVKDRSELTADVLRALLTDTDPQVRVAACRHRPPRDLHAALLADPATRGPVVRFLDLDADTAAALAGDPDEKVRAELAAHPLLPPRVRDLLAQDASPEVRGKVFTRADTPPELRDEIHAWLTAGARRAEKDGENAEEDDVFCDLVLVFLEMESYPWVAADPVPYAASPYTGLRLAAARSERLPAELVRRMLDDEDPTIRMTALHRTPDADLATAEDIERRCGQPKFRGRSADHFTFPPEALRRFAADPDAGMRVLALRDPDVPAALLERLAADGDHTVRRTVAEDSRTAPGTLLRLLGDDSEYVAAPAAASPNLPVEAMRAVLDLAARDEAAERGSAVLLCGPSASGRDARARDLERRGYTRLTLDEDVRDRLAREPVAEGTDEHDRLRAEAQRELWCELEEILKDRAPVLVDHGVLSGTTGQRYRALFESHGYRCEVVHIEADPTPQS